MVRAKSALCARFMLMIIASHAILDIYRETSQVQAANYKNGMNPGMLLKLDITSIDAMKMVFGEFLPKYLMVDMNLLHEYSYAAKFFQIPGLEWDIAWSNIKYS